MDPHVLEDEVQRLGAEWPAWLLVAVVAGGFLALAAVVVAPQVR